MLNSIDKIHEMPKTDNRTEWALFYASLGIPVFPLQTGTKDSYYCDPEHPGAPTEKYPQGNPYSWKAQATTDPEQIRKIFNKYPKANIGGVTGNGLYVVDSDVREDGNGLESIEKWEKEGILPGKFNRETWISITGSGGRQYFYFLSKEYVENAKKNNVNLSGDSGMIDKDSHIDTRGDGRYVNLPPSEHPNGNSYRWDPEHNPGNCKIAQFDRTIEKIFTTKGKKEGSRQLREHNFEPGEVIPYGSRYDFFVAKAGQLVSKNLDLMDDEAIVSALMSLARTRVSQDPPFSYEALEKKLRYMVSQFRHKDMQKREEQDEAKAQDRKERVKPTYYKASELAQAVFPREDWIINNILKPGLTILSAKSKVGKSWMSLDMAVSVARGTEFLGNKTTQGKVLYMDLENGEALGQERLILQTDGTDIPEDLFIVFEFPQMGDSFYEDLEDFVVKNPGIKLIIIDVLKKVWKSKRTNQSDDEYVYETLAPLKDFAKKHNLSIVALMHNRKSVDPDDPCSNICGSQAYMAVSDECIVIWKDKRADSSAHMFITGRTVTQEEYFIQFNKDSYKWEMIGTAEAVEDLNGKKVYEDNPVAMTIRKLVDRAPGHRFTAKVSEIIRLSEGMITTEPKETGGIIRNMLPLLKKYDNIGYYRYTNGTGSAPYTFYQIEDSV